ncbi:MAG: metal ABC transporter substrate-binding protein [Thermincola sp.]|jgi:zinc transport system substrate-binding protein|nr:metal ABC transporter substrate-binding protein [Thermincola sp.]MDT3703123.1 metal ABC transporter substrate-binding protein [Thermincola sp.]
MRLKSIKLLSGLIMGLLLISIIGCSKNTGYQPGVSGTANGQKDQLTIATSFYPMYIMAINVAKDIPGVQVVDMTPPTSGCLHDYQITTNDLKVIEKAQVFVVNGAGMEAFMDKVVKQQPDLKIVEASKGMEMVKNASDGLDNPHLWVSISCAIQQVKNIGEQLAVLDPSHAEKYRSNTTAYVGKLESLQKKMHQSLDNVKTRDIVTFHEAFPYFAKEFNLNIVAVVEREPGSQPSAGELADTIKVVRESKVKALFAEPQYPAKAAETIARETGAKVYDLDPAVTGPMEPDAYLNIMNNNLKVLEEALK